VAVKTKSGYEVDNRVYSSNGLQFRLMFLAKSHVAHDEVSEKFPFLCLVCIMLKNSSETYCGRDELSSHIMEHQERVLGETPLEGPLVFGNNGVNVGREFDINLPKFESLPPTPEVENGMSIMLGAEVQDDSRESDRYTKVPFFSHSKEVTSPQNETFDNPWIVQ
jgi:hypothetical protein